MTSVTPFPSAVMRPVDETEATCAFAVDHETVTPEMGAPVSEHHQAKPQLVQIRKTRQAPEDLVDDCGHPKHAALNLHVTPHAGCDGFEMAAA